MTRFKLLAIAALCLLSAGLLVAGCGSEDPEQVLEDAAAPTTDVQSGVVDITVGVDMDAGNADLNVTGPFEAVEGGLPKLDLTATLSGDVLGQSIEGLEGGLISTGDAGFINYQGTDYELDPAIFQQLASALEIARAAQPADTSGDFSTEGLSDLENEGDEDVEGVETTHVSGSVDTSSLDEATASAVEEATFDMYVGKDDDIIRRFDASVSLNTEGLLGGVAPTAADVGTLSVNISVVLSDINQPQTIEAPADPQPASELSGALGLESLLGGFGGLGALPGAEGGDIYDFDGPGGVTPGGSGGGEGGAAGGGASGAYLDCIDSTTTPEEIANCVEQP